MLKKSLSPQRQKVSAWATGGSGSRSSPTESRSMYLAPRYGILLRMMSEHEEFEVETGRAGEPLLAFWS